MKTLSLILMWIFTGGMLFAQNPGEDPVPEKSSRHIVKTGTDGSYFYTRGGTDQDPGKVYYKSSLQGVEMVLFDPLIYKNDALYVVYDIVPDLTASQVAVMLSAPHLQGFEGVVVDLEGSVLDHGISDISGYGFSWLPDGEHFLYHRLNNENANKQVWRETKTMLHRVGEPQKEDSPYLSSKSASQLNISPEDLPVAEFHQELNAVIAKVILPDNTIRVYLKRGDPQEHDHWELLADEQDKIADLFCTPRFIYYKTALDAGNYKIMAAMIRWPDFSNAELVVPEFPEEVITDFLVNREGIFVVTRNSHQEYSLKFRPRRADMFAPANAKLFSPIDLPGNPEEIRLQNDQQGLSSFWIRLTDEWSGELYYKYQSRDGMLIKWNNKVAPGVF